WCAVCRSRLPRGACRLCRSRRPARRDRACFPTRRSSDLYWGGEVDVCINAMTLANGLWLRADVSSLPDWFVEHTMDEGGWNCEWQDGSRRASFHSTLNALRALHEHERLTGGTAATREAQRAGEEYLLRRNL